MRGVCSHTSAKTSALESAFPSFLWSALEFPPLSSSSFTGYFPCQNQAGKQNRGHIEKQFVWLVKKQKKNPNHPKGRQRSTGKVQLCKPHVASAPSSSSSSLKDSSCNPFQVVTGVIFPAPMNVTALELAGNTGSRAVRGRGEAARPNRRLSQSSQGEMQTLEAVQARGT